LVFLQIPLNFNQHLNPNIFFFFCKKIDISEIFVGFNSKS